MTNKPHDENVFGALQMGYAIVESNKLQEWRRFLKQGIGLHEVRADDGLAFRMDEHARRFIVRPGPAEDFVALGYQVRDASALDIILARLTSRKIEFREGSPEEAAQRGVQSFIAVRGPKDLPIELFTQPVIDTSPLAMLATGFVTGPSGMGHVALTSRQPEKVQRFWQEIFDARLSDRISQKLAGVTLDVAFLRLNERHHSVAIAATRGLRLDPIRTKAQHINMVAASLSDVTGAFVRLRDLGFEMAHEIGQHPNDHEISFYVLSPSGFEVELGWAALTVDESTWTPDRHYNAISSWGHKPEKSSALSMVLLNIGTLYRGVRSLFAAEHSPL